MDEQQMAEIMDRLNRLESLMGSFANEDGQVVPALLNAAAQTDLTQMAHEIMAVVSFLRENRPGG